MCKNLEDLEEFKKSREQTEKKPRLINADSLLEKIDDLIREQKDNPSYYYSLNLIKVLVMTEPEVDVTSERERD